MKPEPPPEWVADGLAVALRRASLRLTPSLALTASVFVNRSAWTALGYARSGDFARERLGRSSRWLSDLAVLGGALERLPLLQAALLGLDDGPPIGRAAAVNIARHVLPRASSACHDGVALPPDSLVSAWVQLARQRTVRELREELAAARAHNSRWPVGEPGASTGAAMAASNATPAPAPGHTGPGDRAGTGSDSNPLLGATRRSNHWRRTEPEEDAPEDCREIRLTAPASIVAAFEEALDLHRAVNGFHTSVASFAEALAAEAAAGVHPPDVAVHRTAVGIPLRSIELALARANRRWHALDARAAALTHGWAKCPPASDEPTRITTAGSSLADGTALLLPPRFDAPEDEYRLALQLAAETARTLEALPCGPQVDDPSALESRMRSLVRLEDALEVRLGALLDHMGRRGFWRRLGFAGVGHYCEERLGLPRRTGEARAALSRALSRRPQLRAAYAAGSVGAESAALVCRLLGRGCAGNGVERTWVEHAQRVTVKRLRDELRLRTWRAFAPREDPDEAPAASIRDERSPEGALSVERLQVDGAPDDSPVAAPATDAEWHRGLRREPGMSRRRVFHLGTVAWTTANADVFLRLRLPESIAEPFLAAIESERARLSARVESVEWDVPWPDALAPPSIHAARAFCVRCRRTPAWVGLLALLEDYVVTWDDPRRVPVRDWDATYTRDGYRCMAPGCTGRQRIEDHHLIYRSREGSDEPWNQLCLCRMHHQQGEHGRFARCRGPAPLGVKWRLGRIDAGSWFHNERRLPVPLRMWTSGAREHVVRTPCRTEGSALPMAQASK